jgi:hypothetical protein
VDTVRETGQTRPALSDDDFDGTSRASALAELLAKHQEPGDVEANTAPLALIYVQRTMKRFGLTFGRPALDAE